MNYFIVFIARDGFEWCVLESTNKSYAQRVFDDLALPPDYEEMELRCTDESVDVHLHYDVLDYAK